MISHDKCPPTSTAVTHTHTYQRTWTQQRVFMRTEREGGKKRKERNNKELLFTTCSSLEKFQEKQLGRWKLSYLERMRRCSKRQSLALTVKTHQRINDSREHVPSKHTSKITSYWNALSKHTSKWTTVGTRTVETHQLVHSSDDGSTLHSLLPPHSPMTT